jgi:hypothetical protein
MADEKQPGNSFENLALIGASVVSSMIRRLTLAGIVISPVLDKRAEIIDKRQREFGNEAIKSLIGEISADRTYKDPFFNHIAKLKAGLAGSYASEAELKSQLDLLEQKLANSQPQSMSNEEIKLAALYNTSANIVKPYLAFVGKKNEDQIAVVGQLIGRIAQDPGTPKSPAAPTPSEKGLAVASNSTPDIKADGAPAKTVLAQGQANSTPQPPMP